MMYKRVQQIVSRLSITLFGTKFSVRIDYDQKVFHVFPEPRVFIQLVFLAINTKGEDEKEWKGRKWYLSEYMTDSEIVNTVYLALEIAVKHEMMESFKVDGKALYNPHLDFEALLKVTEEGVRK